VRLISTVAALLVAGCSRAEVAPTVDAAGSTPPAATSSAPQSHPTTCTLVTAAEMSAIVGTALSVDADESGGGTCTYKTSSTFPFVKVEVDWGSAELALTSMGMLGGLEPEMAKALSGVGDQAMAIGPALMIRTGEDLITLTLMGLDDVPAKARRILETMRPRMGPTSQPRATTVDPSKRASDEAAKEEMRAGAHLARQLLGGVLSGAAQKDAPEKDVLEKPGAGARENRAHASAAEVAARDISLARASSTTRSQIPLVKGLTQVIARHEPGRGDYEPIIVVDDVNDDEIATTYSAETPEGDRLTIARVVRRADLRSSRTYRAFFRHGDPPLFEGTTHFSVSAAVFSELKNGRTAKLSISQDRSVLGGALAALFGNAREGGAAGDDVTAFERVEPFSLALPILINDERTEVAVLHARSVHDGAPLDYYVLDDPDNPIVLRAVGRNVAQVIRLAFPVAASSSADAPLEAALKRDARVELHGIYFDFGKDTIRPESEPVIRELAAALAENPGWNVTIDGHTDNIGGDSYNLDLSRRRAAAVKSALTSRYRIADARLTTAGYGASQPKESNDTLSGRARNRRVEVIRQ
jgi:outer membrane protein OmpA-like peptidoglycan-associated protein